jgi:hypothetical protein
MLRSHIGRRSAVGAAGLDALFDFGAKKGNGHAYGNAPNAAPLLLDPVTGQPQG